MKEISISEEYVERKIYLIRGHKVMLDEDLAELYHVETKNLIKAVKRNAKRFPKDFAFSLKKQEVARLRFQFGTSKERSEGRGGRRYLPYAFTEQGVAMLSSVLRSKRAVEVNIEIMRAFVRLRSLVAQSKELSHKLVEQLMTPPKKEKKRVGFRPNEEE